MLDVGVGGWYWARSKLAKDGNQMRASIFKRPGFDVLSARYVKCGRVDGVALDKSHDCLRRVERLGAIELG